MSNTLFFANGLHGRQDIYTGYEDINSNNVVEVLNEILPFHLANLQAEEYLYWYRRGITPILDRKKERNKFVCNRVNENHAEEIVTFKDGYFLTQPAYYIARNTEVGEKVKMLNEYLYRSGKQQADNEVVDWFHTVGKGALIVEPNDDPEYPVSVYALDPRSAFVVYSLRVGHKPVMGVNMVVDGNRVKFDVYTRDNVFRVSGGVSGRFITNTPTYVATAITLDSVERNLLGKVPIIEYRYNSVNMGAFEAVVDLLNALDDLASNRLDGVEQFIQSLIVLYNADLPNGVDAETIKQQGMLLLKSYGDNKSDIKVIAEQLDQSQTQKLVDWTYQQILTICGVPDTTASGANVSGTTGVAVLARDGWFMADTFARNTEDLFRKSNRYFDEVFLEILRQKNLLDIGLSEFELQIVRNETANIQSKAQAFQTLLAAGMHPELAAAKSGVSNDPVSDMEMSEPYLKMIWGDPGVSKGEAEVIEEDRFTGDNDTGGAV